MIMTMVAVVSEGTTLPKNKPGGGKAASSGISLTTHDAAIVEAMIARGDRDHDIASWFGVNGGRIIGVKNGEYGPLPGILTNEVPPAGSPGPKARRLRSAVEATYE